MKKTKRATGKSSTRGLCCENVHIITKNGIKVCINCGFVLGIEITQKRKRAFNAEEVKKRRHTYPVFRDFGPRTVLPNNNRDHYGHKIKGKKRSQLSRLSKIQRSLTTTLERNLWEAKPKLSILTSKMNIPEYVQELAWRIYSLTVKKKLTMGRSIDGFIAASLYVSIRVHEIPRLFEEICENCMVSKRTITRCLGVLIREVLPELNLKYKSITPESLIFRFGNKLRIPIKIQKRALILFERSSKNGLSINGKDPKGFAASAIYLAAKPTEYRKTQTEVSNAAKITEVTLRTRIKEIQMQ